LRDTGLARDCHIRIVATPILRYPSASPLRPEIAMIRKSAFALIAVAVLTCATAVLAEITFEGGDGATIETAIVIMGAAGEQDGVASEYEWLAKNRPDAQMESQALLNEGDKIYDLLVVRSGSKKEKIYFDITAFFGKF
jgi:hypothetical protein